ncbi:MAG: GNAT family N-acetyltransferase [Candidatus Marinimicrobia bacterium]|nr:GNAT family N-acetyltransferase [Candidatus Neomarinimicrobiota bacterium]MBL7023156.1 GNAT family N-acetyltransferase [Candidatus Neomarinimicrobiota bacterium]MBL7109036.1 GNAT family N-acetyltransferase [Candidatus Neomarinimicrobiota bacterium]
MIFRNYNAKNDNKKALRIWQECGWLDDDKNDKAGFDAFMNSVVCRIIDINDSPECMVTSTECTLQYQNEILPLSCVTSVNTSRIARKKGFALQLTAQVIAEDAKNGADVSTLGMFEQGFYNKLGYGTGGYEHIISFDPSHLRINVNHRTPTRLSADDWEKIHHSRINRLSKHGYVNPKSSKITKAETLWSPNGFGLGYFDKSNILTHHLWFSVDKNMESGPYRIAWMSYQNYEQFLELMAVVKSLGDQIRLVSMHEPSGIQMQDLLDKPFRNRIITKKSDYEHGMKAVAYWQMRICNLVNCLQKTHLNCTEFQFNLKLTDPIEKFLTNKTQWRGISGNYIINLGESSNAEKGHNSSLPTLTTTVNAFTRLWLGVVPASGLVVTDDISAPKELIEKLDLALRLPRPTPDWEY